MIEKARSRISRGSTSTAGRGTEPASGIGTLEKSGLPPGRTAGSGTYRLKRWSSAIVLALLGSQGDRSRPARGASYQPNASLPEAITPLPLGSAMATQAACPPANRFVL